MHTVSTRKQAIEMGLKDGREAAMDAYHAEMEAAANEAALNKVPFSMDEVLKVLRDNTGRWVWGEYAGHTGSDAEHKGEVPRRWRAVYEKALVRGAVHQSRSLLNDLGGE